MSGVLLKKGALATLIVLAGTPPLVPDRVLGQAATADWVSAANDAAGPMLGLYDREGKVVRRLGERGGFYSTPALSPDGRRLAVSKLDETTGNTEIWVLELSTNGSTRITSDPARVHTSPVWSPDGSRIVYAANPGGSPGLYLKAADGTGSPELLYQHPIGLNPTDWSRDGRFLTFFDNARLYVLAVPSNASGDRQAIEIVPGEGRRAGAGYFSPDGRFLSYSVTQAGTGEIQVPWEVWVRPFDPSTPGGVPAAGPWRISAPDGGWCTCGWRQDGREMYYLDIDNRMMAVEISTASTFTAGTPRRLFQAPSSIEFDPIRAAAISRDGQQFVMTETAQFANSARALMVFDRDGKTVGTIGGRGLYNQPVFSPDRTRVAVIQNTDLWIMDVASGASTRIVSSKRGNRRETIGTPIWSPDGRQVAYVAVRNNNIGFYRKAATGEGPEELLHTHPGQQFGLNLTDWSMDGRFLLFGSLQLGGNILYALPLEGERQPLELLRSRFVVQEPRISPDGRFLAYRSNETGRDEIYVRAFNPAGAELPAAMSGPWQVSNNEGALGMIVWRQDGAELSYIGANRTVKAVPVSTARAFEFGRPQTLFTLPDANERSELGPLANIARDGQRVVVSTLLATQRRQMTVFDRQGNVLSKVGEPVLLYDSALALSPDGTRVAAQRTDPRTGDVDIWTFDIASGKGTPVTNDPAFEWPPIWSPDGRHVAYVSRKNSGDRGVYRKAWDGSGSEELMFQYSLGVSVTLTDWSADGKFLIFHPGQMSWLILVVPLGGDQKPLERKAIEWLREEYDAFGGRLSPDSRYMAYVSDELKVGAFDVHVRPFDASQPEAGGRSAKPLRVSTAGARGGIFWRQDGKEMYYLTPDWAVMAVDVTSTPALQVGMPRLLFRLPIPPAGDPGQWKNVSSDGQRFAFALNEPVRPLYTSLIPLVPAR